MSDTTLFSDWKFNVSGSPEKSEHLKSLVLANGGLISDRSDDIDGVVFIVDSFDEENVRSPPLTLILCGISQTPSFRFSASLPCP